VNVGSTFSGVGGFDLGFERAGMSVVWQAEIDEWCRRVLRGHWPDAAIYDDVRAVNGEAAAIDLLCGGFPCQDLSVAGKRAGFKGERSSLFFEFARIADELRPRWIVLENVVGLLSSAEGRDFGILLTTLAEIGYGCAWRVVDARYFGVPQRRRRVFIVGCLGDDGERAVRALGAGGEGNLEAGACSWQGASPPLLEALEALAA
jgi:DNA (cytosine-5)-methyltransferase 1